MRARFALIGPFDGTQFRRSLAREVFDARSILGRIGTVWRKS